MALRVYFHPLFIKTPNRILSIKSFSKNYALLKGNFHFTCSLFNFRLFSSSLQNSSRISKSNLEKNENASHNKHVKDIKVVSSAKNFKASRLENIPPSTFSSFPFNKPDIQSAILEYFRLLEQKDFSALTGSYELNCCNLLYRLSAVISPYLLFNISPDKVKNTSEIISLIYKNIIPWLISNAKQPQVLFTFQRLLQYLAVANNSDIDLERCLLDWNKCGYDFSHQYSLIRSIFQELRTSEKFEHYFLMLKAPPFNVHFQVMEYSNLLFNLCSFGKLDKAEKYLQEMKNEGVKPNSYVYDALILGAYRIEGIHKAMQFYKEMLSSNIFVKTHIFNRLLSIFSLHQDEKSFMGILRDMKQLNIQFDNETYYQLIHYIGYKNYAEAKNFYKEMKRKQIELNIKSFNSMLYHSCLNQDYEQILQVLNDLKAKSLSIDYLTVKNLIMGYKKNGKILKLLQEIEPQNI